jgi:hypothetical protein
VLVLVNGKRRHTTSLINNLSRVSGGSTPVDIDLIPTNAVGHIEVLRDGAAAQYGSDAISGVINIILDKSRTGGNIAFTGGQFYSKARRSTSSTPITGSNWVMGLHPFRHRGQVPRPREQLGRTGALYPPARERPARPARKHGRSCLRGRLWPLQPRRDRQQLV